MARRSIVALTVTSIVCVSIEVLAQTGRQPGRVPHWPCRLVVEWSSLREMLEDAWDRSPTFRQQCDELANAHAVVVVQWGDTDSLSRAKTRMELRAGVIVAIVSVPTGSDTIELVAHELHHVLERVRGLDHKAEARKSGSGVWRSDGGREVYETQAAIEAGRQVTKEVALSRARAGGA